MQVTEKNKKALGRGLDALIPKVRDKGSVENISGNKSLQNLPIDNIFPGEGQPRQYFEETSLDELAMSIKEHGILQPVIVKGGQGEKYEIIAGERRWRAAKRAQRKFIPCVIMENVDKDILTLALVENVQRQDLNVIEEAEAYRRLSVDLGMSQEQTAKQIGKDRTSITNSLRLLRLPTDIQWLVINRRLSMGHARSLLGLPDVNMMNDISSIIIERDLNVRQTENLIRKTINDINGAEKDPGAKKRKKETFLVRDIRLKMEKVFKTKVNLLENKGKGRIIIHFSNKESLNNILGELNISM